MAGDFSVIVDPYLWKRLKNDDDDQITAMLKKFPLYLI